MTYKNYIKALLIFIGIIIFSTLTITLLYQKDILNIKIIRVLEFISLTISSIISGFYIGIKSKNKGYINGLILGSIIITILFILSLITSKINIINIIAYLIILILITTSSILGINKRR